LATTTASQDFPIMAHSGLAHVSGLKRKDPRTRMR
jgi:hypothetical protein